MKKLFSLYDGKAHLFTTPIESVNMATAKRLFRVQVERAGFPLSDYQVAYVADFNEEDGSVKANALERVEWSELGGNEQ